MTKHTENPYVLTHNLHPFFAGGTMDFNKFPMPKRSWLYISDNCDHLFSDYPDTHYLSGPSNWEHIRDKIKQCDELGVDHYKGMIKDLNVLLNDLLILTLAEKRQLYHDNHKCWMPTFEGEIHRSKEKPSTPFG